jgi:hypothetical protein
LFGLGIDFGPAAVVSSVSDVSGMQKNTLGLSCLVLSVLVSALLAGCEPTLIPNTRVEDTSENREVIDFIEKYRIAIEGRNVEALLALASENYFDDMGTPAGADDIDYEGLKAALQRVREEISGARYQISYRAVTYDNDQHVLVDVLYTGWFRVNPVSDTGPEWKRRLEPHRIILARDLGQYRILSGM